MSNASYELIIEELEEIRKKIKNLRRIPAVHINQQIIILKKINQLLKRNNILLTTKQKYLEDKKNVIGTKVEVLVSRFT